MQVTHLNHEVLMHSRRGDRCGEHHIRGSGKKSDPFKFLCIDCGFTAVTLCSDTRASPWPVHWWHSPVVPSRASGRAQASLMSSLKRECSDRPREEERDAAHPLHGRGCRCCSGSSWKGFVIHGCSREEVRGIYRSLILYIFSRCHILHPTSMCPKAHPLHQGGGLGWGIGVVWRL